MANAKVKLYYTSSQYLDTLPVVNGNIIFVQDTHAVCLDMHDKRISYSTIYVFEVEQDRINYPNPGPGFYYVKYSNTLWRYDKDKGWKEIIGGSDGGTILTPIIFTDTPQDFPETGQSDQLYISDNGVYKWKINGQNYHLVANKNEWGTN